MISSEEQIKEFREKGFIILEDVFSSSLIDQIRYEFQSENLEKFKEGFKRELFSVEVKDSINSKEFLFNPKIISLIEKILNPLFVIESVLAPTTGPGSEMQHKHNDGGGTYGGKYDIILPAHAVGLMIPLIDMNTITGTTRLWPYSHTISKQENFIDLEINKGSCFLIDTRIMHAGTPNKSSNFRPMIYITYSFPWYINYIDFRGMPCFKMSDDEFLKWDKTTQNRLIRRNIQAGIK